MSSKPIHWVDTDRQLAEMVAALGDQRLLALDTEFMRTDTFYAKLALVQLCDGESIWLIDFPALSNIEPLRELLNHPQLVTLVHACGEDLDVLESAAAIVPAQLFDTQLAAAYLNRGFSLGYARLVEQLCGVELDKQATRSDWLQRPLTSQQRSYAACDVDYLHAMHSQLAAELTAAGRRDWFDEEMADLLAAAKQRNDGDHYYLKLAAAWEFSQAQLAELDAACSWREQLARSRDLPRGRIFKDPQLVEAVRRGVANLDQLRDCGDIHPASLRKYGEALLAVLAAARSAESSALSGAGLAAPARPLTRAEGPLFKALRHTVQQLSAQLNIAKELAANKRDLEQLVRQVSGGVAVEALEWPARLASGWRQQQFATALSAQLSRTDSSGATHAV